MTNVLRGIKSALSEYRFISSNLAKGVGFGLLALIAVLAFLIIFLFPFIFIWSLNVLFPVLAIPYSIQSYFASACVSSLWYNIAKIKVEMLNKD